MLKLGYPCKCERCENPCRFGSGVLADEDYERLAKHLGITIEELKKNHLEEITKFGTTRHRPKLERKNDLPYGKCTFFDEKKGCKVHESKPLECKVAMGCKEYGEELILWFDHKHFFNPKNHDSLREYKTYVESGGKILKGGEIENFLDEKKLKELEEFEDIKKSREKDWEKELGADELRKKGVMKDPSEILKQFMKEKKDLEKKNGKQGN